MHQVLQHNDIASRKKQLLNYLDTVGSFVKTTVTPLSPNPLPTLDEHNPFTVCHQFTVNYLHG